jgi:Putative phage abortive infection protein
MQTRNRLFCLGAIALALVAIPTAAYLSQFGTIWSAKQDAWGQFGDFFGGMLNPIYALLAFLALLYNLNLQSEQLRIARDEQAASIRSAEILSFEAKYFELLRLHRENVSELQVDEIKGRKLFVVLIREFRLALEVTKEMAELHGNMFSQLQFAHIAYYCLLFGTGPNSSRVLARSLGEFDSTFVNALVQRLADSGTKRVARKQKGLKYIPFEGHQSRLAHYYRHLYQAVQYVDQQEIEIDKYQYVKTIRAQLSNHEQALLLLNSLTPIGRNWRNNNYLNRYRMVQNIPREFFDPKTELDLQSFFEKNYFEWEEEQQDDLMS